MKALYSYQWLNSVFPLESAGGIKLNKFLYSLISSCMELLIVCRIKLEPSDVFKKLWDWIYNLAEHYYHEAFLTVAVYLGILQKDPRHVQPYSYLNEQIWQP